MSSTWLGAMRSVMFIFILTRGAAALVALIAAFGTAASAQQMEPRAYSPAPVGTNFVVFSYAYQKGDVLLDSTLPLPDAQVKINFAAFAYGYTFNLAGRQANASVALPYVWGRASGELSEEQREIRRSGLGDLGLRFSLNLIGSPALSPRQFAARKPSSLLGASLTVVAPTGQYNPRRLVNLGSNRWSFKPELGLSIPVGRWTVELYGGVWLFTDNNDFLGGLRREQKPLASFQAHVIYTLRPRLWLAANANYYTGGRTVVEGTINANYQSNSRVGATISFPVSQRQSVKGTWAKGLTTRIGGNLTTIAVGWQYVWFN